MHRSSKRYNSDSEKYDSMEKKENEANMAISELITNLKILIDRKDKLVSFIRSPKMLLSSLNDLYNLIEMVSIKHSIVNQIKFLIANQARIKGDEKSTFEGHMLNSVIVGEPGTGKTTVAKILAKIWTSLGFIKKKEQPRLDKIPLDEPNGAKIIVVDNCTEHKHKIKQLEDIIEDVRSKNKTTQELINKQINNFSELRIELVRLNAKYPNLKLEIDELLCKTRGIKNCLDHTVSYIHNIEIVTNYNLKIMNLPILNITPEEKEEEVKFVIARREDLVGQFVGHTAPKTKSVLESARGGVLFLDEAYSLTQSTEGFPDKFGDECLVVINEFMSTYPDEIVVIFAGYKDMLNNSIFKVQPGLQRRIANFYNIESYSYGGLSKIFKKQLESNNWFLAADVNIEKILNDNKDIVSGEGGFTEKLCLFAKIAYGHCKFIDTINNPDTVQHDSVINNNMIDHAIKSIRDTLHDNMVLEKAPDGMYI